LTTEKEAQACRSKELPRSLREGDVKISRLKLVGLTMLLGLSVIWGLSFVVIRRATFELSPINLTLLRWLIAGAGFLVVGAFLFRSKVKFQKGDFPRLLMVAVLSIPLHQLLLNFGETQIHAGVTGLLTSLSRVFMAVLSVYLLREKVGGRLVSALILGITGATVLALPALGSGLSGPIIGIFAVILAAFCFALFSVVAKPLLNKYGAAPVTVWSGLIGTIMLLPLLSSSFMSNVFDLSLTGWLSVLYLAILSSVIGYLLFYTLVSHGPVTRVSVQLYLIPFVSVIGGVLLLQEDLTINKVVGGALLLLSVAVITSNRISRLRIGKSK
jgi:drug/metabolite transporter (DMT)-like permease